MTDTRYWSKDLIRNFIEEYRLHPCLWKVKSEDYKNKSLKNRAYDKLVEICREYCEDANRDNVFKKIQSLRGSFRKELKKVVESKRNGAGEEDIYSPTLWYYDLLLFTVDQEIPTSSNMKEEVTEEGKENEDGTAQSFEMEENTNLNENTLLPPVSGTYSEASSKKSVAAKAANNSCEGKKSVAKRHFEFVDVCENQIEKSNDDEYEALAVAWGKKLKRMDPIQALYAESVINKTLIKGLLNKLTESTVVEET